MDSSHQFPAFFLFYFKFNCTWFNQPRTNTKIKFTCLFLAGPFGISSQVVYVTLLLFLVGATEFIACAQMFAESQRFAQAVYTLQFYTMCCLKKRSAYTPVDTTFLIYKIYLPCRHFPMEKYYINKLQ